MYIDARPIDIIRHYASEKDFEVFCAGYIVIEKCDSETCRSNGLDDFQLIYIKEGCGYFKFENEYIRVGAGHAVLFRPGEPQIYHYLLEDRPKVCWMHFSGTAVENLLKDLNIYDKRIITVANDTVIWNCLWNVIGEFTGKRSGFIQATVSNAILALVDLSRNSSACTKSKNETAVEHICQKIRTELASDASNAAYAAECDMSVSHFLRMFKQITGTSPQNYKLRLRIAAAKNLLVNSDYKIGEISNIVGFSDPMYFCKYFKKETGFSPSEFKERYR